MDRLVLLFVAENIPIGLAAHPARTALRTRKSTLVFAVSIASQLIGCIPDGISFADMDTAG
jgi:hypothetical protein